MAVRQVRSNYLEVTLFVGEGTIDQKYTSSVQNYFIKAERIIHRAKFLGALTDPQIDADLVNFSNFIRIEIKDLPKQYDLGFFQIPNQIGLRPIMISTIGIIDPNATPPVKAVEGGIYLRFNKNGVIYTYIYGRIMVKYKDFTKIYVYITTEPFRNITSLEPTSSAPTSSAPTSSGVIYSSRSTVQEEVSGRLIGTKGRMFTTIEVRPHGPTQNLHLLVRHVISFPDIIEKPFS